MDFAPLNQLSRHLRQFQFVLRNDAEASGQFRILVLGIITCLALYYAGNSVIIGPKTKKLQESRARKTEIAAMGSDRQLAGLGPKILQLQQKKKLIMEDIAILELREKFQREHWKSLGDPGRFNNIIFTMTPAAPISIDGKLLKMNLGEKRTMERHDEQPITLSGKGKYQDVLAYLHYMENSPEVGSIDNLAIKAPTEEGQQNTDSVHFSMLVSRIMLKD